MMRKCCCIHFNGLFDKTPCAKGVPIGTPEGPLILGQCFMSVTALEAAPDSLKESFVLNNPCKLYKEPTDQEIEDSKSAIDHSMENIRIVQSAVMDGLMLELIASEKSQTVTRDCPICGGKLKITYCAINHHTSVMCLKNECVRWTE